MFTITTELIIAVVIGVLLGILIACLFSKKERSSGETFWSRVFTSNQELDSTIGIFAFVWVITLMVLLFQDALSSATEVGYIILAATNGLSGITGVKMGANMKRSKTGG